MYDNEITVFQFETKDVRTVTINDEPWFVAKDVAEILGYSETNRMTARLDDDETMSTKLVGMNMNSTLINESGLYNSIIGSNKHDAKHFKKWITSEVLPSIRKHGAYMTQEKIDEVLTNPDTIIKLATELKEERKRRVIAERTKSWIGSKREATAMNTAANAVKKLNRIENEIGIGKIWKRVTCIPWIGKYFDLDKKASYSMIGKRLAALSETVDQPVRDVPDERFGTVKAYHISVIEKFHEMIKEDVECNILKQFRKNIPAE